jgi:hypothetical protein
MEIIPQIVLRLSLGCSFAGGETQGRRGFGGGDCYAAKGEFSGREFSPACGKDSGPLADVVRAH